MAATCTLVLTDSSSAGAASYSMGSFAVVTGELFYAVVVNTRASSVGTVDDISASGNPINFEVVGTRAASDNTHRITMLRGVATDDDTANCTLFFNGGNQSGALWMVVKIGGASTRGNGADSILQFTTNGALIGAGALVVNLAAFSDSGNGTFAGFMCVAGTAGAAFAPDTGYSEITEEDYDSPTTRACIIFRDDNDTSPSVTGDPGSWLGLACEVVAGSVADIELGACGVMGAEIDQEAAIVAG